MNFNFPLTSILSPSAKGGSVLWWKGERKEVQNSSSKVTDEKKAVQKAIAFCKVRGELYGALSLCFSFPSEKMLRDLTKDLFEPSRSFYQLSRGLILSLSKDPSTPPLNNRGFAQGEGQRNSATPHLFSRMNGSLFDSSPDNEHKWIFIELWLPLLTSSLRGTSK